MGEGLVNRERAIAEIFDNLRRIFQVIHGYSKRAERAAGLTGPQTWALKVLEAGGTMKVSDLARRMYLHPSTVVGILDRLVALGLVVRRRSREDRRIVYVSLTDKGRDAAASAPLVAQVRLQKGLEACDESLISAVAEGMDHLVDLLGAREIPPRLLLSPETNLPEPEPGEPAGEGDPPPDPQKKESA